MGNSSSKNQPPAHLPIGVFAHFTQHPQPIHLNLEIQPARAWRTKNNLRTVVTDSQTRQQIFTVSPVVKGNGELTQTLFDSSNVALLTLTSRKSPRKSVDYICRLATTGEEIFRANESRSSGAVAVVYTFHNRLGEKGVQSMRIKLRKKGLLSAGNLDIGSLSWHSRWKSASEHQLVVNPQVDIALMTISTLCLHRISQARSTRANRSVAAAGAI